MNSVATRINRMGESECIQSLLKCCGSERWAERVCAARPFDDDAALFERADSIWRSLEPEDWHEAFLSHPRIGENKTADGRTAGAWSSSEQKGMDRASESVREQLRLANQEYEQRFGHIFLICASGLDGDTMLARIRERLVNDKDQELEIAASEQAKITRLRLRKLVDA